MKSDMTSKLDAWPVRVAATELRQYTEFAFGQLERRMVDGFTRLERLQAVDSARLERLERKLDQFIDSQSQRSPRRQTRRRKP